VARILQEREDVDSCESNHGGQAPLSPSSRCAGEFAEMQFSSHDPNTDITDFNGQDNLIPATHGEWLSLSNHGVLFPSPQLTVPQPIDPRGPDLFPSDPESSSPAQRKLKPSLTTSNQSSCLCSACVPSSPLFYVLSPFSFIPSLPHY